MFSQKDIFILVLVYTFTWIPYWAAFGNSNQPQPLKYQYQKSDLNYVKKNVLRNAAVELAVFMDSKMKEAWKIKFPENTDDLMKDFALTLIQNVDLMYHQKSLGMAISFHVVKLEFTDAYKIPLIGTDDVDIYLKTFCKWQLQIKSDDDHWDHALLLTGYDVRQEDKHSTVGLSNVNGMCVPELSCTIAEGANFVSAFIIAHEFGHSFGMNHDGIDNTCPNNLYIMSSSTGRAKTSWSVCSRNFIVKYLRDISTCIFKTPTEVRKVQINEITRSEILPGQRFDGDAQCQLFDSTFRRSRVFNIQEVCQMLMCTDQNKFTHEGHPALDGTYCGNQNWCINGECVPWETSSAPQIVDGGWSEWSTYSECHDECFGFMGTQNRSRTCTNPKPENGGKECQGTEVQYKTCKKECRQIIKLDVQVIANAECTNLKSKVPLLTGKGKQKEEDCMIWCLSVTGSLRQSPTQFPDGVDCSFSNKNHPSYCGNGKCQKFNCDGIMLLDSESPPDCSNVGAFWNDWKASGNCQSGCLSNSIGIQVYKRTCSKPRSDDEDCTGSDTKYHKCDAGESCKTKERTKNTDFANSVCMELSSTVQDYGASGYQNKYDSKDPKKSCLVFCIDPNTNLYKDTSVVFPDGTQCHRSPKSYCIDGMCTEFDRYGKPVG